MTYSICRSENHPPISRDPDDDRRVARFRRSFASLSRERVGSYATTIPLETQYNHLYAKISSNNKGKPDQPLFTDSLYYTNTEPDAHQTHTPPMCDP